MWWPASRAVPADERLSFVAWRAERDGGDDEYPPRAQVGRYLADGFETLLPAPPAERRSCGCGRETVEAAELARRLGWLLRTSAASARIYDEVLLAVGHQRPVRRLPGRATALARRSRARRHGRDPRLRADLHRCRARADRRARRLVRADSITRTGCATSPASDDAGVIFPFSRSGRPMLAKPGPALDARVPALGGSRPRVAHASQTCAGAVDLLGDLLPTVSALACANLAAASGRGDDRSLRVELGRRLAEAVGGVAAVATSRRRPRRSSGRWRSAPGVATPDVPGRSATPGGRSIPRSSRASAATGCAERDWPAFLRLAAEMERVAFGPPALNAAKLLALRRRRPRRPRARPGRRASARRARPHASCARSAASRPSTSSSTRSSRVPAPAGHAGLLERPRRGRARAHSARAARARGHRRRAAAGDATARSRRASRRSAGPPRIR